MYVIGIISLFLKIFFRIVFQEDIDFDCQFYARKKGHYFLIYFIVSFELYGTLNFLELNEPANEWEKE